MNAVPKSRDRKQFIWPAAGILIAALVAINPFYHPRATVEFGIAAWFADLALVLILSMHQTTARLGSLVAGLFLAIPCFVRAAPLPRFLLMCFTALPLAGAALPLLAPQATSLRARLLYLFTWLGTREVKRRARDFEVPSLLHLLAATVVFAAAMTSVKAVPAAGLWLLVRWLAGGIMIFAVAEIVTAAHYFVTALMGLTSPALMQSPYLSTSIGEFWTKRWNPAASMLVFRTVCFTPLARRSGALALWAAFFVSAVGHALLPQMATGRWDISFACGAFFLVQPLLIAAERRMRVRRWRPAAARVWTLSALTITSPLFVEPALQVIEPSWGAPDNVLLPTIGALGFVIFTIAFLSSGSLIVLPALTPPGKSLAATV